MRIQSLIGLLLLCAVINRPLYATRANGTVHVSSSIERKKAPSWLAIIAKGGGAGIFGATSFCSFVLRYAPLWGAGFGLVLAQAEGNSVRREVYRRNAAVMLEQAPTFYNYATALGVISGAVSVWLGYGCITGIYEKINEN
jgi:hypothetical protein